MPHPTLCPARLLLLRLAAPPPLPALAPDAPLPPLVVPPTPDRVPDYTALDPSTGLHMTGTPQHLQVAAYRLRVTGKVSRPLTLAYDDLRRLPRLDTRDPIVCRGYFEDYARWAGASLEAVLDRAGPLPAAKELELESADGYRTTVTLAQAHSGYALLAYEWEGKALPVLHGFPVRAVFPGQPGSCWVKWLVAIRVR
jgi:DMSO/TMAO reductase YedYZ molybdopterin-dependent catalytic subunit